MRETNGQRLGRRFLDSVMRLSRGEVLHRYQALSREDRLDLEGYAFEESAAVLNSEDPPGERMEAFARCFDVFADADDAPPWLSSAQLFRERAYELRHPEEWRERQRTAAMRKMPARRLRAMNLVSSCMADGPVDVRLRQIEDVLVELHKLADEAVAEGELDVESAIGEDIVSLWRLREAVQDMS